MKIKLIKPVTNKLDWVEFTGKTKRLETGTEFVDSVPSGFTTVVNGEIFGIPKKLLEDYKDYFEEIK